jgi:cell division protein FtsB
MRDVTRRIQRYRLSRYAAPENPVRRRLPWLWVAALLWLAWVGVISDHSLWRIWRLSAENRRAAEDLVKARESIARLERESEDPGLRRQQAERWLREQGGMARPGEIIYRIQDGSPDTVPR